MDDDSEVVRTALRSEFERLGDVGIDLLRKLERSRNRVVAHHARQFITELRGTDTLTDLTRFIRSLNYELETGSLMINRAVQPDLDVSATVGALDRIGKRVRELLIRPAPPWEQCNVVNRVLFHDFQLRGNVENFYDPANSLISSVLTTKRGIPISLSTIYILVAQRAGINVEPVSLPRRFMVGCFMADAPFYIDPFENGIFRSRSELIDLLKNNRIEPRQNMLAPAPVGEVLWRTCRNLTHQYGLAGDGKMARLFSGFAREFELTYARNS